MTGFGNGERDNALARYEALVRQQLCKCVLGPYWIARNNCPLHPELTTAAEIAKDQRGFVPAASDDDLFYGCPHPDKCGAEGCHGCDEPGTSRVKA